MGLAHFSERRSTFGIGYFLHFVSTAVHVTFWASRSRLKRSFIQNSVRSKAATNSQRKLLNEG